ncbi:MAG TPA: hypothetical protein VIT67_14875 [Povalibacter sp.]|jgi:hypothetical protein
MDETRAFSIVSALANGVNPLTGEVFPADSPYQTAEVVRALFLASKMLEAGTRSRPRPAVPGNAGKPWTADEDQRLLQEFDRGTVIAELARSHGRTTAGIQARLEKHGRIQASATVSNNGQWRSGRGDAAARRQGA